MSKKLSLVMITKDCELLLDDALKSAKNIVDEIIVVDDYSKDKTVDIAKKYGAKIYKNRHEYFGGQKAYGLKRAFGEWVLILDSDERLTSQVKEEINRIINLKSTFDGYNIGFNNHFLGRSVSRGGENYKKLILFKRNRAYIKLVMVHEEVIVPSRKIGKLKNKINHYSYRSLYQVYRKFTIYALKEARQKYDRNEKASLKKILLYPFHMFWARFIKDKGYKDGIFRIPLDLGFAYMELLTYISLFILTLKKRS